MTTPSKSDAWIPLAALALLTGCTGYGGLGWYSGSSTSSGSSGGLAVYPNATTLSLNQSMAFQVSGGTPPYQYQVNGVGYVDGNGNYQAGSMPGQAQILVTDANSYTGSAQVTVAQTASGYGYDPGSYSSYGYTNSSMQSYRMVRPQNSAAAGAPSGAGWISESKAALKRQPPVQGQVIAVEDRNATPGGPSIHSKYVETGLKHPVVRVDTLVEDQQNVAVRALVEDQFLVTLQNGSTEQDLRAVAAKEDAHVSRRVRGDATYLVSLNRGRTPQGQVVSQELFARRKRLKQELKAIGKVTPNYVLSGGQSE